MHDDTSSSDEKPKVDVDNADSYHHSSSSLKTPRTEKIRLFASQFGLKRHQLEHSREKSFKCNQCDESFFSSGRLKNHQIQTHIRPTPFACQQCKRTFTTAAGLKRHQFEHSREKPHKCNQCDATFSSGSSLKHHQLQTHIGPTPFACQQCERTFTTAAGLKVHKLVHSREKPAPCKVKCDQCGEWFVSLASLRLHRIQTHTKQKQYGCRICLKSFPTTSKLRRHTGEHARSLDQTFKCDECEATFASRNGLRGHRIVTHQQHMSYKCEFCQMPFSSRGKMLKHMVTHTGEKPHKCSECAMAFRSPTGLKNHYVTAHTADGKPYACEPCATSFSSYTEFKQHAVKHAGEKPFQCQVCSARFSSLTGMGNHNLWIHSKEKSFACELCASVFATQLGLARHLLKHNDQKPFTCDICKISYKTKRFLDQHIARSHAAEKPQVCEHCDRGFDALALSRHRCDHKPYACGKCDVTCFGFKSLVSHSMRTHGKKNRSQRCSPGFAECGGEFDWYDDDDAECAEAADRIVEVQCTGDLFIMMIFIRFSSVLAVDHQHKKNL